MTDRELTASEAAAFLGYTLQSLYNRAKDIPHTKRSGALYFRAADLTAFNESRETRHEPTPQADGDGRELGS